MPSCLMCIVTDLSSVFSVAITVAPVSAIAIFRSWLKLSVLNSGATATRRSTRENVPSPLTTLRVLMDFPSMSYCANNFSTVDSMRDSDCAYLSGKFFDSRHPILTIAMKEMQKTISTFADDIANSSPILERGFPLVQESGCPFSEIFSTAAFAEQPRLNALTGTQVRFFCGIHSFDCKPNCQLPF